MRKKDTLIVENSLDDIFSKKSRNFERNLPIDRSNLNIDEKEIALKTIKITKSALKKLFFMAKEVINIFHTPLEMYVLTLGKNNIIEDFLIPQQFCSHASILIRAEDILTLKSEISKNDKNVIGWAHSHANFNVFFSSTDYSNQKTLLAETGNFMNIEGLRVKYTTGITINIKEDIFGIISTQFESGNIINMEGKIEIINKNMKDIDYAKDYELITRELCKNIRS